MSLNEVERSTMTWRWAALSLYLLICFYDFMFVPIWYGLTRPDVTSLLLLVRETEEVLVQVDQVVEGHDGVVQFFVGGLDSLNELGDQVQWQLEFSVLFSWGEVYR